MAGLFPWNLFCLLRSRAVASTTGSQNADTVTSGNVHGRTAAHVDNSLGRISVSVLSSLNPQVDSTSSVLSASKSMWSNGSTFRKNRRKFTKDDWISPFENLRVGDSGISHVGVHTRNSIPRSRRPVTTGNGLVVSKSLSVLSVRGVSTCSKGEIVATALRVGHHMECLQNGVCDSLRVDNGRVSNCLWCIEIIVCLWGGSREVEDHLIVSLGLSDLQFDSRTIVHEIGAIQSLFAMLIDQNIKHLGNSLFGVFLNSCHSSGTGATWVFCWIIEHDLGDLVHLKFSIADQKFGVEGGSFFPKFSGIWRHGSWQNTSNVGMVGTRSNVEDDLISFKCWCHNSDIWQVSSSG
ncbi:hypothetical protein OGAPHI_004460 [Ogataea philodendri]|uniref:Secreted protein n=1 Tax=Ogataea philodendri TaxID=1378263 RepID=A0A9P8T4Z8_9ASCO|nr:uncharacterized protein OGAPHI_004460 [Ogataea philodendri]KAH3666271.1 hypothetical protein OGAPHI_004460 [Ogataea philodendri]